MYHCHEGFSANGTDNIINCIDTQWEDPKIHCLSKYFFVKNTICTSKLFVVCMYVFLIDWLTDRLTDWFIDWLMFGDALTKKNFSKL